ncbi:matrixin family metalloprotease [Okeania sp.]|uniref:matrixin family metalloprotease n=1 Tax=Okeania sp. TaxID=3100323 RepID=UPI002B4B2C8C|nr:matrixin family metalloprotease [Okeania sp.]MEB3340616.1 matrixin family metalloprotease [Okeania sp.]
MINDPDSVLVFVDAIFSKDSGAIFPKNISNATADEIALAIANVTAHEIGHAFGLEHIKDPKLLMNGASVAGELLNSQIFSDSNLNIIDLSAGKTAQQNDQERLAFGVGSDIDPSIFPGTAPPTAVLEFIL